MQLIDVRCCYSHSALDLIPLLGGVRCTQSGQLHYYFLEHPRYAFQTTLIANFMKPEINLDFLYGELRAPTTWDAVLVPQLLAWKEMFTNRISNMLSRIPTLPQTHDARIPQLIARQTMNTSTPAEQAPRLPPFVPFMTTKAQMRPESI
jgi:hypothetical protein